jgi:hypothetical protein
MMDGGEGGMWRADTTSRLGFGAWRRIVGGFALSNLDAGDQKGRLWWC